MTREEAIHIVKTTKDWSELREALAVLVPELTESEGDKAKRLILDLPFKHEADYKFVKDWLEKQEQKPAEDEKLIKLIISILEDKHPNVFWRSNEMESGVYTEELVDFLKSCRPSFKLSEEQIYTLERICSNLHLRASDDAPKLDEIIKLLKQK